MKLEDSIHVVIFSLNSVQALFPWKFCPASVASTVNLLELIIDIWKFSQTSKAIYDKWKLSQAVCPLLCVKLRQRDNID